MSIANRRQRERQERRISILDAAESTFAGKGFDQATMDDIASAAELSKGTLYIYFKSKDDLSIALASRLVEQVVEGFEIIDERGLPGIDAIRAMMGCYTDRITENPQMFRIMMGRLASGNLIDPACPSFERHRRLVMRVVELFVGAIERGRRDGSIRLDIEASQTASQLWSSMLGVVLLHINRAQIPQGMPKPTDFTGYVDGYIDLVCSGLAPKHSEAAR